MANNLVELDLLLHKTVQSVLFIVSFLEIGRVHLFFYALLGYYTQSDLAMRKPVFASNSHDGVLQASVGDYFLAL